MESVVQTWLALVCKMVPGVSRGAAFVHSGPGDGPPRVTVWPAGPELARQLAGAAQAAQRQGRPVEVKLDGRDPAAPRYVAAPIPQLPGAVALELEPAASPGGEAALLARCGPWLERLARGEAALARVVTVLELIASSVEHEDCAATLTALVTELARRFGCERVAIGLARGEHLRVEALSHSARFDPRSRLIRDLVLAMEEAADQDAPVVFPAPPKGAVRIALAHERLAQQHGGGSVCTVPLAHAGRQIGALTFQRRESFDAATLEVLEDAVALVGPVLALRRRAEASLTERVGDSVRRLRAALSAPDRPALKGVAGLAGALLLLLVFGTGQHRVTADATLEGRVQRAIVAGADGYIAEAHARPGDLVHEGDVLGRLDERDLVLERRKWSARLSQVRREHREALAAHDRTRVQILSAKAAQADAQVQLLTEQLARTRLIAPFDGIVVKGDLSQALGSPVAKGDVLFEVAPLDGYRVILKVDERDIRAVTRDKRGKLVLSALPGKSLPFAVERVTPVSRAEDGRNYFRVEARLMHPPDSLRPGMEGMAKIDIERRRLVWIWTHRLLDALRLWAWSWWP